MKKNILLTLFLIVLTHNCYSQEIQTRIDQAFYKALETQDMKNIENIIQELETSGDTHKKNKYLAYWNAYALYRNAIILDYNKKPELVVKELKKAQKILDNIENKTSEDYALQAHCINFSIQFAGFIQKPLLSSKVNRLSNQALELCKENIRAYLVLGINDFYTPKKYGGGKKCLSLFLKALSLPEKTGTGLYDPSWGKDEIYFYIVNYYLKEENKEKASEYLKKGLQEFPDNNRLLNIKL